MGNENKVSSSEGKRCSTELEQAFMSFLPEDYRKAYVARKSRENACTLRVLNVLWTTRDLSKLSVRGLARKANVSKSLAEQWLWVERKMKPIRERINSESHLYTDELRPLEPWMLVKWKKPIRRSFVEKAAWDVAISSLRST